MEFREVRSLVALGRFESIARAAQEVNLTPAAVHKQIKNLESEFGMSMYEKSGRGVQLTQAAHAILPHLEALLAQHDAVMSVLTDWKGVGPGVLRIGANPAISGVLIPRLLQLYRREWPDVAPEVEVEGSGTLLDHVANHSLDLAIGIWDDSARTRVNRPMRWEYKLVAVASEPWPEAMRLRDLSRETFVLLPVETYLGRWVDDYLARQGCRPARTILAGSSHTIISMIRHGLGIGLLPGWAVAREVAEGHLHIINLKDPALMGTLDLITPKTGYTPKAVRAFIELALREGDEHLRPRRK